MGASGRVSEHEMVRLRTATKQDELIHRRSSAEGDSQEAFCALKNSCARKGTSHVVLQCAAVAINATEFLENSTIACKNRALYHVL